MKTRFVKDQPGNIGQSIELPPGSANAILFESKNLTVPTGTALSIGLDLVVNGKVRQSLNMVDLPEMTDILLGMPTYTTTPGSPDDTVAFAALLPLFAQGLPNAQSIDPETTYINFRSGNCTGGSLSIYLMIDNSPENYVMNLSKLAETGSGRQKFTISQRNVAGIFIKPRAATDRIQVIKDGMLDVDAYGEETLVITEIYNRLEAGTHYLTYINLCPSREITELVSKDIEVIIEHAVSGTSTIWVVSCEFEESRIVAEAIKLVDKEKKVEEFARTDPGLGFSIQPYGSPVPFPGNQVGQGPGSTFSIGI